MQCAVSRDYLSGTVVNLVANAAEGYSFDHWTGACADDTSVLCSITMNVDQNVVATFNRRNASAPDSPYLKSPRGSIDSTTPSFRWDRIDNAHFYKILITKQNGNVMLENSYLGDYDICYGLLCYYDNGHDFTMEFPAGTYRWNVAACNNDGCTTSSTESFSTGSTTGTGGFRFSSNPATFESRSQRSPVIGYYTLTPNDLLVSLRNTSTSGPFTVEATIPHIAAPGEDFEFKVTFAPWALGVFTGSVTFYYADCVGGYCTGNPKESAMTLVGHAYNALSVQKQGTGAGKIYSTPSGISCPQNCFYKSYVNKEPIQLRAEPDAYSSFGGWSGACTGTNLTCTVVMTTDTQVYAHFVRDVTPPPPPGGVVEVHDVISGTWQAKVKMPEFAWQPSVDDVSGVWGYEFYFGTEAMGMGGVVVPVAGSSTWQPSQTPLSSGTYYLRGRTRAQRRKLE